jgi:hypothetical protein
MTRLINTLQIGANKQMGTNMKKLKAEDISINWHRRQYRQAGCESKWKPPEIFNLTGKRNPKANRSKYIPDGIKARITKARLRNSAL